MYWKLLKFLRIEFKFNQVLENLFGEESVDAPFCNTGDVDLDDIEDD